MLQIAIKLLYIIVQFGTSPPTGFIVFQSYPVDQRGEVTHRIPSCGQNVPDFVENEVQLCRSGSWLSVAHYRSGVTFDAAVYGKYMNFVVKVPKDNGHTRGVLGSFGGHFFRRTNPLTPISNSLSNSQLFPHLETCKRCTIADCFVAL